MALEPTDIPPQPTHGQPIVRDDRVCAMCDYPLRGLPLGGQCPECGASMRSSGRAAVDDPLSNMPPKVIRTLRRGCALSTLCVVAAVILLARTYWFALPPMVQDAALLMLSALWWLAVVMVTPSFAMRTAVAYGFGPNGRLRRVVRWFPPAFIAAAAAHALARSVPGGSTAESVLHLVTILGIGVGAAGTIALCVLLQRLAQWVRDDDAERALNLSVWVTPVATLLLFTSAPHPAVQVVIFAGWLITAAAFPYGLLSLSASVALAVEHAREAAERERRRMERQQQHDAELDARLAQVESPQRSPADQP